VIWSTLLIVASGLLAAEDPGTPEPSDATRIQGTWVLVSSEQEGEALPSESLKAGAVRLIIKGNEVLVKMGDMTAALGTFALDPTKSPGAYDRTYPSGAVRRGIYRLDETTLTICLGPIGKERPSAFATKPGDGCDLAVYQRESP
jgi:uncharacterized protein (TIGR03067 family)